MEGSAGILNSLLDGTYAGSITSGDAGSLTAEGLEGACFDYAPEQTAPAGDPIVHLTIAVLEA